MTQIPINGNGGVNSDARSLDALRLSASRDPKTAAREAARQFEGLFMQELMKSMRSASMASGMLDNEGSRMGTEMLDSQLATQMAGRPGGLSDMIARQLERQMGVTPGVAPKAAAATAADIVKPSGTAGIPSKGAAAFVQQHTQAAQAAEAKTGIPATFMIAQAAHETGWGKKDIRNADGSSANNLFGIKAGAGWTGPVAEVTTTEYMGGVARKVVQKFRAYASAEESFADYAKLMKNNPRYSAVVAAGNNATGFAQGLQRAGYATDPAYADKLARVINTTLRLQRTST